jgi:hypothetical protein
MGGRRKKLLNLHTPNEQSSKAEEKTNTFERVEEE